MTRRARICILVIAVVTGRAAYAQASALPTTKSAVGEWDAAIVKRAEEILSSPALWDRADTTECTSRSTTFSIQCAIQRATDDVVGVRGARAAAAANPGQPAHPLHCTFHSAGAQREGSCGMLFDEAPILTITSANAVTTGKWRADMQPSSVWSGKMAAAESPVGLEARRLVDVVTTKKYPARLAGYNRDSTTTFGDVQNFFHLLEDRVRTNGAADLEQSTDDVEIEAYSGGKGVIRTYNGWFSISGFTSDATSLRFDIDTLAQIPSSSLDRQILERAVKIISSEAVWNRKDDRKCPADATTWSIYCAEEKAMIEVTGGFHHRRPASELVRVIVDERSKGKNYSHRLMDYNNEPSTKLDDVRSLFAEAIARIKQ
jgi:hypothetical protein